MSESPIDWNKEARKEAAILVMAALLFCVAAWGIPEPDAIKEIPPVEFIPTPDTDPVRPSSLMEWPLAERMVPDVPETTCKTSPAIVELTAEKKSAQSDERSDAGAEPRRRWRHHRRHRRY